MVFAFVLGVSFLILMLVFRSIVIPIKAIIMNLLSERAPPTDLLVLVFQKSGGVTWFPARRWAIDVLPIRSSSSSPDPLRALHGLPRLPDLRNASASSY